MITHQKMAANIRAAAKHFALLSSTHGGVRCPSPELAISVANYIERKGDLTCNIHERIDPVSQTKNWAVIINY